YTVTPRFFDGNASMLPLDESLSVAVDVEVGPFRVGKVRLGFTRGFVQSEAFVRHFGMHSPGRPHDAGLVYDTSQVAGANDKGEQYTYEQEYEWLGFTARERIFELLDEVLGDPA